MPIKSSPVIYEVNLAVDVDRVETFDEWLLQHTQEMLAIEGFVSASTSVPDVDDEFKKYRCVQFSLSSQAALDHYFEHDAARMREKLFERFGDDVEAERRVLSVSEAAVAQQSTCANCGALLEGRFCSVCGQREEPRVPTMAAVAGEVTNEMFGVESRLWRSVIKLFFKPGELSRVYLAGQRQKYMSPIRLYLLFSIMTFAFLTLANNFEGINIETPAAEVEPPPAETPEQVTPSAEGELEPNTNQSVDAGVGFQPNETIAAIEEALSEETGQEVSFDGVTFNAPFLSPEENALIESRLRATVASIEADIRAGNQSAVAAKFFEPVPTALFIFLPLVAVLFKILYLGSGKYYVEHLIYILHNHAFMFLAVLFTAFAGYMEGVLGENNGSVGAVVFCLVALFGWRRRRRMRKQKVRRSAFAGAIKALFWMLVFILLFAFALSSGLGAIITMLWMIYVPFYMYRSMRVVYQRGPVATLLSFFIISIAYSVMLAATLISSAVFVGLTYE